MKRQTVKKLVQCVAIIAAGVLAIILFMLAIWCRGKNSEPVTDEQVAAQMQQAEPLVIETPEAAAEGSIRVPVGNLTSQLFANIYLDALDQFIKHELGVEAYIRYMDDFVILSPDKEQLRNWLARIEQFLREELKLEFNPKTTMLAAKNGIDFVGYKHRATHRKVRKDSIKRIKRTIKKCESGKITKEQLQKSIQSWTGHAGHADSYNLRKKIETLAEAAIEKAA